MTDISTEDRVATLHAINDDAAKLIGAQRQTISELRGLLNNVTTEYESALFAMGIREGREVTRQARAALKATGEAT